MTLEAGTLHIHHQKSTIHIEDRLDPITSLPHVYEKYYGPNQRLFFTVFSTSSLFQPNVTIKVYTDQQLVASFIYDLIPNSGTPFIIGQIFIQQPQTLLQIYSDYCKGVFGYLLRLKLSNGTILSQKDGKNSIYCYQTFPQPIIINYYQIQDANTTVYFQLLPNGYPNTNSYLFAMYFTATALKNCLNVQNSNQIAINQTNCQFNLNFVWNVMQQVCKRQCSKYLRAFPLLPNSNLQCQCAFDVWNQFGLYCPCPSYLYYNSSDDQCYQNCAQVLNSNGKLKPGSLVQCQCNQGYFWNEAAFTCQKQCLRYSYGNRLKQYSNDTCLCLFGQFYDNQSNQTSCVCPENFIKAQVSCSRNCSLYKRTLGLKNDSLTQCRCINGQWNQQQKFCPCLETFIKNQSTGQCQKDCSIINKTNSSFIPSDQDTCHCLYFLIWSQDNNVNNNNEPYKKCIVNCSLLTQKINDTVNQNAQYMKQLMQSKCQNKQYKLPIWAIITIIILIIIIFNIIIFAWYQIIYKKKRNWQEQKDENNYKKNNYQQKIIRENQDHQINFNHDDISQMQLNQQKKKKMNYHQQTLTITILKIYKQNQKHIKSYKQQIYAGKDKKRTKIHQIVREQQLKNNKNKILNKKNSLIINLQRKVYKIKQIIEISKLFRKLNFFKKKYKNSIYILKWSKVE